jgi:predicted  nucleic acid-binding Zn ribbon protein
MRLTVEERVFILEIYLKTMSYAHCRQSFFEKFRILKMNITRAIEEVNERTLRKTARNMVKRVEKCIEMNGYYFQHLL